MAQQKPWIIPDFLKVQRNLFVANGDVTPASAYEANLDSQRMENCKSKKAKGISAMMQALNGENIQERYDTYLAGGAFGTAMQKSGFIRG